MPQFHALLLFFNPIIKDDIIEHDQLVARGNIVGQRIAFQIILDCTRHISVVSLSHEHDKFNDVQSAIRASRFGITGTEI
ncbi:hypothetical protein C8R34_13710 [Nitrosomonas sp. Nm84]|nr:hypothetical protein C8R34_13710 [Nitrosomonas sp. Nm84]